MTGLLSLADSEGWPRGQRCHSRCGNLPTCGSLNFIHGLVMGLLSLWNLGSLQLFILPCFGRVVFETAGHSSVAHHHHQNNSGSLSGSNRISLCDRLLLIVGGTALFFCAIAFIAQACRISIDIVRSERRWRQEEGKECTECAAQGHLMSDLEAGNRTSTSNLNLSHRTFVNDYVTRHGRLTEQVIEVNGIRKSVLVIDETFAGSGSRDAYADWFQKWRTMSYTSESIDERTPLMQTEL